jgi:dihydropteroate synthase
MGILNVTPDSFSDGGVHLAVDDAVAHGVRLAALGADIVDIGGESTRPGSSGVDAATELARVESVIERLVEADLIVSIDTMKSEVARAAVAVGAEIINDVSGFRDPAMRAIAAESGAGIVIMHMLGSPRTMQANPAYGDVVVEVAEYLEQQARLCVEAGVDRSAICVDPGIGFGKTVAHNLALIEGIETIVALGYPVMVGASRKSFIGTLLDIPMAADRDLPTAVVAAMAVERGAHAVRVHDPWSSLVAAKLARAIVVAGADRRERQR